MIRRIISTLKSFAKIYKTIEGFDWFFCCADIILNRQIERVITIGSIKLSLRTNTPDIDVAISSLVEKEYENIALDSPNIIIDAGANIGTSAIYFARKFPLAKIIAIEPEESNFNLLIKNTNQYQNVIPIKAALWRETEERSIQDRLTGQWGFTVADTNNTTRETGQLTSCITVLEIMKRYTIKQIDLLKMDIEGGEKDVFETSADWISFVKVITAELHDNICMGCDRAFYLATINFSTFEKNGEKVTAYAETPLI